MRNWLSSKGVTRDIEVGDETWKISFYPVTVRKLLYLKDILKEAVKAMSAFQNRSVSDDFKITRQKLPDGTDCSITEPIASTVVAKRQESQDSAVDSLVEIAMSDQNVGYIVEILWACMRDENFDQFRDDPMSWADEVEAPVMIQLIKGFLAANKKILPDPFVQRIQENWTKLLGQQDNDPKTSQPQQQGEPSKRDSEEHPKTERKSSLKVVSTPTTTDPQT